ncbi:MAG: uroporphyrinogen-III synthase [Hyphomicrobiales bacterium]|jgi:uroporphyrinogen-III synthase
MRVLLTRPEPDGLRSAARLRALGHDVILAPLMRGETLKADFGGPFAAVLMTSANAARAILEHPRLAELRALPVCTVGDHSAEVARAVGFAEVVSAQGALDDLVRLVAARFANARLLYLAGEDRAGDLAAELAGHRIKVETAVVYRAVAATTLPPEVAQALGANQLDAVLHYSRRSAATLLQLAAAAGAVNTLLGLAHYCLSDAVAVPLREAGARRIAVAPHPGESSLFGLF